ncbi:MULTISPECIES: DUF72 domain-containing protein [Streptomyces]|uniref:DUF72 domain-containing protein n=1 Tax=Streptomyces bottropensis ATCC 25435 TaxID=1054862 RepID=M3FK70_9ACTN|nr:MULTISPECIES: DUF72 domain-containing protein [Streptomyces]EMF52469.1 hypothetical protein SBD_5545 [Streptomyces bottropensis ATCC 25435]MZD21575.1 DUF72 domain-containing protein [Streptomyces sp. SID5476]
MGDVLVGTCSWTDRALLASGWYPRGHRDAGPRLRYYAERFPVVEVDSSYYALPSRRNSLLWAERTPPGFRFDVKAFSLLTGHPTRPAALPEDLRELLGREPRRRTTPAVLDRVWERFADAVEPLRETGRLGAVLFQFPPWFAPGERARQTLEECAGRTAGWPVSVEFRHPAWWRGEQADRTAASLSRLGLVAVGVDMAQDLETSLPPLVPVTSPELAVVRFHGRSPDWGTGSKEDRFRYAYSPSELAAWAPRLRSAAEQVDELHVLFNNCCADAAVRAAETTRRILDER